jgi:hypothetical protein
MELGRFGIILESNKLVDGYFGFVVKTFDHVTGRPFSALK